MTEQEQQTLMENIAMEIGEVSSQLLTAQDLWAWGEDFEARTKFWVYDDIPRCLYTDGDSGYMFFSTFCECFDADGLTVKMLSNYCDISMGKMAEIESKLQELIEETA